MARAKDLQRVDRLSSEDAGIPSVMDLQPIRFAAANPEREQRRDRAEDAVHRHVVPVLAPIPRSFHRLSA